MYRFINSIILLLTLLTVSCSSGPDYHEAPEESYDYYSGGNLYGNHYCKVQTFTHKASGKKVTLIGMIHTADQNFYEKVDEILDRQDLVLEEGIHGLPSFGVHKYFSSYLFYTMRRFTYLQELSSQGQLLKDRENTVLADMSSDEFASQGSLFTPLIQLASLPIMIIFTEPYYLLERSQAQVLSLFSEDMAREKIASLRHLTLNSLELTDKPSSTFLPGIINSRNVLLIEKLEEQIEKKDVQKIAIPWGASHLPSLEVDLVNNGYTKDKEFMWLQTVAVEDYLKHPEKYSSSSRYIGIPYIIESELSPRSHTLSILFSSIKNTESRNFSRFSLLYGDLLDNVSLEKAHYFSLFPRIFGKPLIFDSLTKNGNSRYRFLWFFSIGELE